MHYLAFFVSPFISARLGGVARFTTIGIENQLGQSMSYSSCFPFRQ